MCGLIGIMDFTKPKFYKADVDIFIGMLLLNSMRGMHSTGAFGVDKNTNKADTIKNVGTPYHLLGHPKWSEFHNRFVSRYSAVIGHGRYATRGAVNPKNAHPFFRGDITLVHNGTLTNFDELKRLFDDGETAFQVDSDILANMIHTFGIERTLKEARGAYAMIWHNKKERTIHFIRNYERPLSMYKRSDTNQILLASEDNVLEWAIAKGRMKGDLLPVKSGIMYSVNLDTGQMTEKDMYPIVYPKASSYSKPYAGFFNYDYDDYPVPPKYTPPPPPPPKNNVVDLNTKGVLRSVDKYTWQNLSLKVGERISFKTQDYKDPVTDPNTHETRTFLIGHLNGNELVEICGMLNGNIEDYLDVDLFSAVIKNITVYATDNPKLCRLWVSDLQPIDTRKPDKRQSETAKLLLPGVAPSKKNEDAENFVELFDNTRIPKHRFEEMARHKCQGDLNSGDPNSLGVSLCMAELSLQHASGILVVNNRMYCPQCVKNGHYPKN